MKTHNFLIRNFKVLTVLLGFSYYCALSKQMESTVYEEVVFVSQ